MRERESAIRDWDTGADEGGREATIQKEGARGTRSEGEAGR